MFLERPQLCLALLVSVTLLVAVGCRRLNPDWCETADRCGPAEYCDPRTNTCQPRELGLADSRSDLPPTDGMSDGLGDGPLGDAPQDSAADLPPSDALGDSPSCSSDQLVCEQGEVIQRCVEAGPVEVRVCPDGLCSGGHCQPAAGALMCASSRDCAVGKLCTLFLGTGDTALRRCASSVPGFVGAGACSTGLDCATGLCTAAGRCYYACALDSDCPTGLNCQAVQVPLEGQSVATTSCAP